jgi:hypothetical protein
MKILFAPATNDINDPADRMRCFEIVEELKRQGIDAGIYRDQSDFDILVILNHNYKFWINLINDNPDKIFVFDLSDDIFSPNLDNKSASEKTKVLIKKTVDLFAPALTSKKNAITLIGRCDFVTTSSKLLGAKIEKYAKNHKTISDPVNMEIYPKFQTHNDEQKKKITIVWTGYGENVPFLKIVEKPLSLLAKKYSIVVDIITSEKRSTRYAGTFDNIELIKKFRFPAKFVKWDLKTVNERLISGDIGIVPITAKIAKSSNKIVTMMAVGLPVVASDNVEYRKVIINGETGFLAKTEDDWYKYLERLIIDGKLRKKIAEHGLQIARKDYSLQAIGAEWKDLLEQLYKKKAK